MVFMSVSIFLIGLGSGNIIIGEDGGITVPALSNPTPLPLDPNDPVIGTYRSIDDTLVCRFYGNGSYIFMSLIHPSVSYGTWDYYGNGHYSLHLYQTESEGKKSFANSLPFSQAQGYDLKNGELIGQGPNDRFQKISANPGEPVQMHVYPSISPETPINRQVGVEVKRAGPDSIFVKVMTGQDVASLVSIKVMAGGREAPMTSGKIGPQLGSIAYYGVRENSDVVVVAEFYDYTHFTVWAGKI